MGFIPFWLLITRFTKSKQILNDSAVNWIQIRLFAIAVFIALLITSIAFGYGIFDGDHFLLRSFFQSSLLLCLELWAILLLTHGSSLILTNQWSRRIEILIFNMALTVFSLEIVLTGYSKISPSPLLWDQSSIVDRITANKMEPKTKYYDTFINSTGYHDGEFFASTESDFVIAMLADSFGVGIVPYDFNYSTIAEKLLQKSLGKEYQRIAIHNFGIPAIGMDDYAYLLNSEVLQYKPDMVLVSVFIGNDLLDSIPKKRVYYAIQNWILGQLPIRILSIVRESNLSIDHDVTNIGKSRDSGDEVPEHIFDWRKEKPRFSKKAYLAVERARVEVNNLENPELEAHYQHFFKISRYFQSMLGDSVFFVLIPDEFQVNDALYDEIIEAKANPQSYIRNYPQSRIIEFFNQNSIAYLDLLPVLKAQQKFGRTYHLQNTHWNARGNKIAGEEIAQFILEIKKK